jgi:hypothetical protein
MSAGWLGERHGRAELVLSLGVNATRGGEFMFRALADLPQRGFLSLGQEEAVRRCRSPVLSRRVRFWPFPRRRMDRR